MIDSVFRAATVAALLSIASIADATAAPDASPGAPGPHRVERARYLMGTLCLIQADDADTVRASRAIEQAFDVIAELERALSNWDPRSEVSRLNAASADGIACSPDLYAVLDSARAMAAETDGAFDPTIEPLNHIWDSRGEGRIATAAERARARAAVDWHHLELEPATRRARLLHGGAGVDLGGIGKGFALDRARASLARAGIVRALLNFGGEMLAIGSWEITIADPNERLRPLLQLRVADAAVSTSAQSERQNHVGGRRIGHIFDPRTGESVDFTGSVTVIASSATRADAYSTALLVMGREKASRFAETRGLPVVWTEPGASRARVPRTWKWNVSGVAPVSGARVEWVQ